MKAIDLLSLSFPLSRLTIPLFDLLLAPTQLSFVMGPTHSSSPRVDSRISPSATPGFHIYFQLIAFFLGLGILFMFAWFCEEALIIPLSFGCFVAVRLQDILSNILSKAEPQMKF